MSVYKAEASGLKREKNGSEVKHTLVKNPVALIASLPSDWRWVLLANLPDYNLAGPHNRIFHEVVQNR